MERKEARQMKRTAGIRFAAIIFLLCCMIACSGASAETTQEENNMTDYDFTAFTNVEITGIDLKDTRLRYLLYISFLYVDENSLKKS